MNRLPERSKTCNFVARPSSLGMVPVKLFPFNPNSCKVGADIPEGRDPNKELPEKSAMARADKLAISLGMLPLSAF